jgi:hypothetical protein
MAVQRENVSGCGNAGSPHRRGLIFGSNNLGPTLNCRAETNGGEKPLKEKTN